MANNLSALAREFLAVLRDAGHRPALTADGDKFHIEPDVGPRRSPEPAHHLGAGHAYLLSFDDRRFVPLLQTKEGIAAIVAALRAEKLQ